MCDRHEEDAALLARGGERLGCYRDQAGHRVLRGFVRSSYTFIIMFILKIVPNPCMCVGGGGGRTARGRVCECAALRATASRAWSGGGSATAATTRPPRTPGHTGRRHSHQTFGKLLTFMYLLYIHTSVQILSIKFYKSTYILSISKECVPHTALHFAGLLTIFFGLGL